MSKKRVVSTVLNGDPVEFLCEPRQTLLEVLREKLSITSPKVGCNTGDCGTCSVLLDGMLVKSCITNALAVHGRRVQTVEGLAEPGELHPLQESFHANYGAQCGFCTPGIVMAGAALLATAKRKLGGQTGDILGATQQVSEVAILIAATALVT